MAGFHGVSMAADEPPVTWAPAQSSVVNPSRNIALDAWESYKGKLTKQSVDQHLDDPVLKGAIDIHAHFGPDSYSRGWDALEIAKMAKARGMRGLVLKNHWSESASTAYLVRKYADVPGLEVFGGLALNATVGGINPQAVRYFVDVEGGNAKVVWMPSHDSEKEVTYLKEKRPYVIVSRNGVLLPEVLEVLDLIAQHKLTLATGHVSPAEMLQIVSEAKKRGIDRIILTHTGLGPMYTDPTIEQLQQAVGMGAYAEVVAGRDAQDEPHHRPGGLHHIGRCGADRHVEPSRHAGACRTRAARGGLQRGRSQPHVQGQSGEGAGPARLVGGEERRIALKVHK
ncbi:MAG: hypothetical protein J0G94_14055 [Sphingomonadales bacterium]|nr:hypothetical protein [Sphingomonadales bacterium]